MAERGKGWRGPRAGEGQGSERAKGRRELELELELIQTYMIQKPTLRGEPGARSERGKGRRGPMGGEGRRVRERQGVERGKGRGGTRGNGGAHG